MIGAVCKGGSVEMAARQSFIYPAMLDMWRDKTALESAVGAQRWAGRNDGHRKI